MKKNSKKKLYVGLAILVMILLLLIGGCVGGCCGDVGEAKETTAPTETTETPTEPAAEATEQTEGTAETAAETTEPAEKTTEATEAETEPASEPAETEPAQLGGDPGTGNAGNQGNAGGGNGSGSQDNPGTQTTEPPADEDEEDTCNHAWGGWVITVQATTEREGTTMRTCFLCGATETSVIPKKEAESKPAETTPPTTEPAPTECQHDWQMIYHPEEGHYGESYVVCICGYRCQSEEEWAAHVKSYPGEEQILEHTCWGTNKDYIVDSPEYYEWICSKCGAVSATQP